MNHLTKVLLLKWVFIAASARAAAQPVNTFQPLKGTPGHDFWIDYYVDHDSSGGIADGHCGTKTYQGHTGTDYLLRSFKTMDSGIAVYSITNGTVLNTSDGHFDRMTRWITAGFGNRVSVKYEGYLITYGHLRKNSVIVKTGDTVIAGQQLAEVGSSGYSCYPHLHLEIRDTANRIVDPFPGPCNPSSSVFNIRSPYDTGRYIIDCGFVPYVPQPALLQERYLNRNTFYIKNDSVIGFWALMHGLHAGCHLRFEWYTPDNRLYFTYHKIWNANWGYDYTGSYVSIPDEPGKWTLKYYLDGISLRTMIFFVK